MQHTPVSSRIRLTIVAAATMLVAGACGSGTTLTAPSAPTVEPTVSTEVPTESTAAPVTTPTTEPAAEATTTAPPTTTTPAPTTTTPAPTTVPATDADDLPAEPVEPEPADDDSPDDDLACALPAMSDDAIIGNEIWVDLDGEGGDNDRIVAYFDGAWKLRAEFSVGVQSEIEISGAGAHGVRALGLVDVDLTYGGDEILAVVGGGASTVEIGVFGFHEGGCIFRYQFDGGGDFSVYSGASVTHGAGIRCGEGYITSWSFQREDDDTYSVAGASFEPVSLGTFGYIPASDDYSDGLSFDDLNSNLFDCNDLSL